jgi:hypothetical protein
MSRKRIRLVCWNAAEGKERTAKLQLRRRPPDAVVIDLGRIPSAGRDVALGLRSFKSTRSVPIVFVEGDPKKLAGIKKQVPDAEFTTWRGIRGALKQAIAKPPKDPAVPESALAGYSGTPLPKKLGIKVDFKVALVGAPADFEKTLGALPHGVVLKRRAGAADLTIWFTKSRSELSRRIKGMASKVGDGGMWIAWPKKASGVSTDLTQNDVRGAGLSNGLVDYKICAIDETWSGLKFARRKK